MGKVDTSKFLNLKLASLHFKDRDLYFPSRIGPLEVTPILNHEFQL